MGHPTHPSPPADSSSHPRPLGLTSFSKTGSLARSGQAGEGAAWAHNSAKSPGTGLVQKPLKPPHLFSAPTANQHEAALLPSAGPRAWMQPPLHELINSQILAPCVNPISCWSPLPSCTQFSPHMTPPNSHPSLLATIKPED